MSCEVRILCPDCDGRGCTRCDNGTISWEAGRAIQSIPEVPIVVKDGTKPAPFQRFRLRVAKEETEGEE
jgi:hypothetical protein